MQFLYEQGLRNGVELDMIPIEEARKKEPRVTGQDGSTVLWSPNTAVVDIKACLDKVYELTRQENENFEAVFGAKFAEPVSGERKIKTACGQEIEYRHMVNTAGQ